MEARLKPVLAALALLAAFVAVGYASISQSAYMDASQLAGLESKTRVTVQGQVIPIGRGELTIQIGGETLEVEAMGAYGVARTSDGRVLAVFLIGSGGRPAALAVYDATDQYAVYMTGNALAEEVVVAGTYDPNAVAVIGGSGELPVLWVDAILKGCHSSYQTGTARAG